MEEHDLTPGGAVTYVMTGPEGNQSRGWWRVTAVDPPTFLEFVDGFADEKGRPIAGMPTTTVQVQLTEHDGGIRMVVRSVFDSLEQMERLERIGAIEVLRETVGQMDAVLIG